ncbi:hypothetical protein [Thalassomonas actiniarum]|uniref:Uncharacterized protein n=1 Tax=Thalassomonas actiniarum TaxID=485447 RepID=A0AAE9YP65_9GAMM|nr:hypothetical protein [Thalassomonas actiniarum]WDD98689.1 hypothetical protein SG35_026175 [Thalassomonas actiniarum]
MPLFSTKSTEQRLTDTAAYIDQRNPQAGSKVFQWGINATTHEMRRIGEKMHIGKSGTANDRRYRRAIIMMRAGVMRHEIRKVVSEVSAINSGQLQTRFSQILLQCAAYVPPPIPTALDVMASEQNAKVELDQARRLQPLIQGITNNRKNLPHEIYAPYHDDQDGATYHTVTYIRRHLTADMYKREISHGNSLSSLDGGGELFIVGHGHLGRGIGSHNGKLGATELAIQLRADGLDRNPGQPIVIYLFSCWGATHTRRMWGGFGKREPYARRFSRALVEQGFRNHKVVGFAGSVISENLTQDYIHKPDVTNTGNISLGKDGMYNIYEVRNGNFNRTHGEDWTTKAKPNNNSYKFWKGWSTLTVRKRGGG